MKLEATTFYFTGPAGNKVRHSEKVKMEVDEVQRIKRTNKTTGKVSYTYVAKGTGKPKNSKERTVAVMINAAKAEKAKAEGIKITTKQYEPLNLASYRK